jgi:NOL1/NOP2/sun family putative RNA methylase
MDTSNIEFKPGFIERYSRLTDFETFKKYTLTFPRRAIRVNTLKVSVSELKKRLSKDWNLTPVPWCKEGFWIEHKREERRDVGNLAEHALGYFYVQEPTSMLPAVVLDPRPGEKVLDMCAAPGSKATQMAAMMQNKGALIANDYKGVRLAALGMNMQRMGVTNCVITLMDAFRLRGGYDRILLDAPCSGTGTIRKSLKTIEMWNQGMIKRLARQQQGMIQHALSMLKPGGTLVYSTCSIDPAENEGVVDSLLREHEDAIIQEIGLNINRSKPVVGFDGVRYVDDIGKCLRVWPQDNDTDGFFVAKVQKRG